MSYIIVKYARQFYRGRAPLSIAAHPNTHTAKECGVKEETFQSKADALGPLQKMMEFNPSANYGIVEVMESS